MSKTQNIFKYMKGVVRQAVGMKSKSKPTEEESSVQSSFVKSKENDIEKSDHSYLGQRQNALSDDEDEDEEYELVESKHAQHEEYELEKYELVNRVEALIESLSPDLKPAIDSILKDSGASKITAEEFFTKILQLESGSTFLKFALDDPSIYSEICKNKMQNIAKLYIDRFFELKIDFSSNSALIYKETTKRGLTEVVSHIIDHVPSTPELHWKHMVPFAIKYSKLSILELYAKSDVRALEFTYNKEGLIYNECHNSENKFNIANFCLGSIYSLCREFTDHINDHATGVRGSFNASIQKYAISLKLLLDNDKIYLASADSSISRSTYNNLKAVRNFVSNVPNSFDDSTKLLLSDIQNSVKSKFIGLEYKEDNSMADIIKKFTQLKDICSVPKETNDPIKNQEVNEALENNDLQNDPENQLTADLDLDPISTDTDTYTALLGNKVGESTNN